MYAEEETITAIATPTGQGGIGIVRISGPRTVEVVGRLFRPKKATTRLQSHRLYLGHLVDPHSGEVLDEVLVSLMKAPHSYTREDVAEINSHSGYLLLSKILRLVLDQGARLARPGEFTLRAFLNGRIDLTQAEAVVDLINAKSETGLKLASQQIQGAFRKKIERLIDETVKLLTECEMSIDFSEEDVPIPPSKDIARRVEKRLIRPIDSLIQRHARKRLWVDGISTVIVGRVNAGKSSLLNRLLDEPRAIVTPIPGTTRDIIESTITIHGLPLRLMDTAGFGRARDEVERIGVRLTEEKLTEADFLLVVIDRSRPLNPDDVHILSRARQKKALVVVNKIDLPSRLNAGDQREHWSDLPSVEISALTGKGLASLRKTIVQYLLGETFDTTSTGIGPKIRHHESLMRARRFFEGAFERAGQDAPMEITALELRSGLDALGEIVGETTNEAVLHALFSRFCIGK